MRTEITKSTPVGMMLEGWITVLPKQEGRVLAIANNYTQVEFSGSGVNCTVVVSRIEIEPSPMRVRLSEVRGLGDRSSPAILCFACPYFLRGTPSICNAFHPDVGVTECIDFPTN